MSHAQTSGSSAISIYSALQPLHLNQFSRSSISAQLNKTFHILQAHHPQTRLSINLFITHQPCLLFDSFSFFFAPSKLLFFTMLARMFKQAWEASGKANPATVRLERTIRCGVWATLLWYVDCFSPAPLLCLIIIPKTSASASSRCQLSCLVCCTNDIVVAMVRDWSWGLGTGRALGKKDLG